MRDPRLIEFARELRRELTGPELALWLQLRAKRFQGAKFRRQQVIGPFIADFACRRPMLIVEVDGDTHATQEEYDEARTRFMEKRGYRVIRFTNYEIGTNLDGVLQAIGEALTPPLPTLSPEGEREPG